MNRWLEKLENAPGSELTKVPKGGSVSFGSASPSAFEEKNAPGNRWLSKLNRQPQRLEDTPPTPTPSVTHDSRQMPTMAGDTQAPEEGQPPAPLHEAESLIIALVESAGRDLGQPLIDRLHHVLAPMGRTSRASLAAAIDDAFEAAQGTEEARQRVVELLDGHSPSQPHRNSLAGRPTWIDWIAKRCPLLPEDKAFVFHRLRTLPPRAAERTARRYVETWHAAATAEPRQQAKDNRGRTAANRTLLALIR